MFRKLLLIEEVFCFEQQIKLEEIERFSKDVMPIVKQRRGAFTHV
ncbi:hypothetical protein ABEP00_00525 [Heyndrickxia sporothermodurans]|nr:hypothetical protein [Heyndrickxia sporothermodurans]